MSVRSTVLALALALVLPAAGCVNPKPPASAKDDTCTTSSAKPEPRRSVEQRRVYRLDFVVASMEPGKPPVSSAHTLSLEEFTSGEIRLGSNIPVSPQARQDVGLMIRCRFTPVGDDLLLDNSVEMTSADEAQAIRKLAVHGNTVVSPGKPALVASAEDPTSHRKVEVTVTATKVR